jgi:hypothetical protein
VLAAVSAATMTSTAAMSTAGMSAAKVSATVRAAEAFMRRTASTATTAMLAAPGVRREAPDRSFSPNVC